MMKLSQLAAVLNTTLQSGDIEFSSVNSDTRTIEAGDLFIALQGPSFDGNQFVEQAKKSGAVAALVSCPVDVDFPTLVVDDTLAALATFATYWRQQFNIPVIGITGSCGKTSTRALLAAILQVAGPTLASERSLNNEIGVPLTLLRIRASHDYAVIEMGANHQGEIADLTAMVKPTVAVITNAGTSHLAGFGSVEGVSRAKGEIFRGLDAVGVAIINNDDPYAEYWISLNTLRRVVTFGVQNPGDVFSANIQANASGKSTFDLCIDGEACSVDLPLMGRHNVVNATAAAAAAHALGIPLLIIQKGLASAQPEARRLIMHQGISNASIIDDSYNANPLSVAAAVDVLADRATEKTIFVLGDMLELGSDADKLHSDVGRLAAQRGIDCLYCYGDHSRWAAQEFGEHGYHFSSQDDLVQQLISQLSSDVTVLIKGSNSMKMNNVVSALLKG